MQIHSSDAIIIRGVTTVFAFEEMDLLITVRAFGMPTLGAALTRILRRHFNHFVVVVLCLIHELLLQIVESPTYHDITIFDTHFFGNGADTGEVFQHEERIFWVGIHECLRYTMVNILHPTVFS